VLLRLRRVEYQADPDYEKALRRLEALGFNIELLGSKRHNLSVIRRLTHDQLIEVRKIILTQFYSPKFRSNLQLIARVRELDKEALAKALTNRRLKPVYLIWENP